MDFVEERIGKYGISSGVNGAYIGRWFVGLLNGKFTHQNIKKTSPVNNEVRIGQIFHFVIGGGVVALFYPVFINIIGFGSSSNHLLLATLFGLSTSFFPWFILMPSFGWGLFGLKAPGKPKTIISPIISHIPYGFGIGLTLVSYYAIKSYIETMYK